MYSPVPPPGSCPRRGRRLVASSSESASARGSTTTGKSSAFRPTHSSPNIAMGTKSPATPVPPVPRLRRLQDLERRMAQLNQIRQRYASSADGHYASMGTGPSFVPLPEDWPILPSSSPSAPKAPPAASTSAHDHPRQQPVRPMSAGALPSWLCRHPLEWTGPCSGSAEGLPPSFLPEPEGRVPSKQKPAQGKAMPRPPASAGTTRPAVAARGRSTSKPKFRRKRIPAAAKAAAVRDVLGLRALAKKHAPDTNDAGSAKMWITPNTRVCDLPGGGIPTRAVIEHFRSRQLFEHESLTSHMAQDYFDEIDSGEGIANFVADLEGDCHEENGGVSTAEIYAMLGWASSQRGETFSETVSFCLNKGKLWPHFQPKTKNRRARSKSKRRTGSRQRPRSA
mmetsp:Transcript_49764/g.105991  ORF Transcript_49764/g.105991 Transcript_49764/m.105991 type:complete len:395 (+) Transcript_49764:322-1506(+)